MSKIPEGSIFKAIKILAKYYPAEAEGGRQRSWLAGIGMLIELQAGIIRRAQSREREIDAPILAVRTNENKEIPRRVLERLARVLAV